MRPALTSATQAGTWFTHREVIKGCVDLGDWLDCLGSIQRRYDNASSLELTVWAVAVLSDPGNTFARQVPDLVTVDTGNNGRVVVGSSYLTTRWWRDVRTRHGCSNRHRTRKLIKPRKSDKVPLKQFTQRRVILRTFNIIILCLKVLIGSQMYSRRYCFKFCYLVLY